ncbi:Rod shape-determining protein MreD [Verrucomicrobia bacterium]|nr:Rod shape-determining protein MreD [Verrucomicrobiota bacterium]
MNWLRTTLILLTAFLAVFWEAAFNGVRHLLGAQIDLLPALMVYAGLCADLATVTLLASLGGLWLDSLSANPLGVSVFPLFACGLVISLNRDLILRDETFAQLVLGLGASAAVPVLTLLLLLTTGHTPLLGWGTLWQLIVMSAGGALATPIFFELFAWWQRTFVHSHPTQSSFRPDRELRRGR